MSKRECECTYDYKKVIVRTYGKQLRAWRRFKSFRCDKHAKSKHVSSPDGKG